MWKTDRGDRMTVHTQAIPALGEVEQAHVAPDGLDALVVGILKGTMATQHVRNLAHEESQVGRLDLDILEAQQRLATSVVPANDVLVQLEPR